MRPNVSGGDQFEDNITHWCCSTALYPMSSGSISVSNTTEGPQASRFKIQTASPLNLPKFSKLAALLLILAEEGGILSPCDQYRKLVPQKFDLMCKIRLHKKLHNWALQSSSDQIPQTCTWSTDVLQFQAWNIWIIQKASNHLITKTQNCSEILTRRSVARTITQSTEIFSMSLFVKKGLKVSIFESSSTN
jgi:hypothetical protein